MDLTLTPCAAGVVVRVTGSVQRPTPPRSDAAVRVDARAWSPFVAPFDRRAWPVEDVACNLCGPGPTHLIATADRYGLPVRTVACESCGLRYVSPRLTAEAYAQFYQTAYRPLVQAFHAYHDLPYSLASIEQDQREYAADLYLQVADWIPTGCTLLDVGGSTGLVGRLFRQARRCAVTVIDPSADELARAEGCATICGAAETVDFPRADVALLCRTMDHLLDPLAVLRRLRDKVRTLIVDSRDVDQWPESARYQIDHPYAFTAATLARMVTTAGWTIRQRWTRRHGKYVGLVCSPQEN